VERLIGPLLGIAVVLTLCGLLMLAAAVRDIAIKLGHKPRYTGVP